MGPPVHSFAAYTIPHFSQKSKTFMQIFLFFFFCFLFFIFCFYLAKILRCRAAIFEKEFCDFVASSACRRVASGRDTPARVTRVALSWRGKRGYFNRMQRMRNLNCSLFTVHCSLFSNNASPPSSLS